MKNIAITGGRGRLAAGVATHLRGAGNQVVLFSRKGDGNFRDVSSLARPEVLRTYDVVLHLGWSTVPMVSEENPGIEEVQDFPYVRNLVAAARQCEENPKLIFFSTAAVYGNTGDQAVMEEGICRPLGRYAVAKLEAERLCLDYDNACVLRITNVFSAGCPLTRPQGIIPVLLRAVRTGGVVEIWGDGTAVKDYIAAPDIHRAAEAAIVTDLRGVFNVSSGCSFSVNDLISLVEEACGRSIVRTCGPHHPWDVMVSHVSSEKLRRRTGWGPRLSPDDSVRELVRQEG